MGIGRATARLLAEEGARKPFTGTICTFGRMSVHVGDTDDVGFFRKLGFSSVESLDYSDFEGATHIVDLNQPIPEHLKGRYDVVLDSGTMEHVFHLPNALKNAVDLAKVGGRVIISAPSSNYMDHGFYMFSPTLFMDFFMANELKVERFCIARFSSDPMRPWRVYEYQAGDDAKFYVGALDSKVYGIFVVATKTERSTSDRIPQQGFYRRAWEGQPAAQYAGLKRLLARIPFGMSAAMWLRSLMLRRGLRGLRYVGKY